MARKGLAMFKCQSVEKRVGWGEHKHLYDAKFTAVTGGTEEKEKFFAATPNGALTLLTIVPDMFEPGEDYYVEISPAVVKEAQEEA